MCLKRPNKHSLPTSRHQWSSSCPCYVMVRKGCRTYFWFHSSRMHYRNCYGQHMMVHFGVWPTFFTYAMFPGSVILMFQLVWSCGKSSKISLSLGCHKPEYFILFLSLWQKDKLKTVHFLSNSRPQQVRLHHSFNSTFAVVSVCLHMWYFTFSSATKNTRTTNLFHAMGLRITL